jgi:anti-sigma-K factor RskA
MSEIHSLSGAYAVDALDDIERAQFERHLAGCPACREEVTSLRETAGHLADTVATNPPPALRERLLAEIATVRPLRPVPHLPARKTSWSTRPGLLVAAAVAAIALGGTAVVTHPWSNDAGQSLSATGRVMQAPDAQRITTHLPGDPTARVTVVRSVANRRAVMVTEGMPPPPSGKTYQAWFREPNGDFVSVGLMSEVNNGPVLLARDAATAVAAAITVEPAGGSPQPTQAPAVVVAFDKT